MVIENPLISIVITNYNGGELLANCLKSVFETRYDNYEVILVDNVSTDNSHLNAKKRFPQIQLITNEKNLGAVGRNSGILAAEGNFIVLLDNDTIVSPNWIDEFFNSYKKCGYGMYQGKLLLMDEPTKINSAGCMINIFGFSFARGAGEIDRGQYNKEIEINFPATACAFIPKDIFDKIGLFDTEFFAYLDDTEFGWRAMKHGIRSYLAPSVIVYHKWSNTTKWNPLKYYLLERNRQICIRTLYSKNTFAKLSPLFILVNFGVNLLYLKKNMLKEKLRADKFIKENQAYLSKRYSDIQKKQIVSDHEIVMKFADNVELPGSAFGNLAFLNSLLKIYSKFAKFLLK